MAHEIDLFCYWNLDWQFQGKKFVQNNNSSDLRIQRLRLSTVGSSSLRVPDNNTNISYKSVDQNFVNSARSRVRGSGGGGPKR